MSEELNLVTDPDLIRIAVVAPRTQSTGSFTLKSAGAVMGSARRTGIVMVARAGEGMETDLIDGALEHTRSIIVVSSAESDRRSPRNRDDVRLRDALQKEGCWINAGGKSRNNADQARDAEIVHMVDAVIAFGAASDDVRGLVNLAVRSAIPCASWLHDYTGCLPLRSHSCFGDFLQMVYRQKIQAKVVATLASNAGTSPTSLVVG